MQRRSLLELVPDGLDVAGLTSEEVEVLGGALGQVLGDECGATGEEEPLARGQPEEQLRDLNLERGQRDGLPASVGRRWP